MVHLDSHIAGDRMVGPVPAILRRVSYLDKRRSQNLFQMPRIALGTSLYNVGLAFQAGSPAFRVEEKTGHTVT